MHRIFLLLLFFLPHETISAAAAAGSAGGCNRQRNGVTVPYPFGFSDDCPIVLDFNDTTSTPLLPHNATAGPGAGAAAYPVMSFDANTSTFVVSIAPSCTRTVSETRASLTGARYGVSSRTGIFLRGGCSSRGAPANSSSSCTVPSELMTGLLRTARCGGGDGSNDTAWTCVTSSPPEPNTTAAARGEGQFMRWEKVEDAGCQDALTSAVYADTPQGVPSVEFGVAEIGWWLDGGCAGAGGGGGCAANATCGEVVTPDGALGHRCVCRDGMVGDGFAAGEGCRFAAPTAVSTWRRPWYPILSFNSTTSTFVVTLESSCNRTVRDANASLNNVAPSRDGAAAGGGYAVSSHTGLFLRGACSGKTPRDVNCSVSLDIMTKLLQTARCGADTAWTCVGSPPKLANTTTAAGNDGHGEFLDWKNVRAAGCEDALTAAVYGLTPAGVPSLEFGVAELGWWLDGPCNATSGGGGHRCAQNATCHDVVTPSGAAGHRCACLEGGMSGDGFAAGDGCHYGGHSKKNTLVIVAGVVAGVVAAGGVLLLCRLQCRRCKARRSGSERLAAMRLLSEAAASSGVPVYSYGEVARATNSFSPTHRLGTGAYGTVYVGKLPSAAPAPVAIKRLRYRLHHHHDDDGADAAAALLLNEIKLISAVSHPNLVRLLGCCLDRGEQILVYEYVPNGTLSQHLHTGGGNGVNGGGSRSKLPWRARLGVAAETAAAIAYLHSARPPIFHRDVKSSNILLDGALRPRLADFGLSRAGAGGDATRSHVSTAPQGTPGYVDPEYHQCFHLSDKSDVYSFGVVLLELITAMKAVDFGRPAAEINLASLGLDRIGKGRVNEIVDPAILAGGEEWVMESVRHVSELAFRCLAFQKDVRPPMSEVAEELRRIRDAAPDSDSYDTSSMVVRPPMMDIQIDVSLDGSDAVGKKKAVSPVSVVQEVWVSDQSSPSTNGSMPRFVA